MSGPRSEELQWPKARRDKEAAAMIADGRFTPAPEWLEKNPQVAAKAAVIQGQLAETVETHAARPTERPTIAVETEVVPEPIKVPKQAQKAARSRRKHPARVKAPKAVVIMGRTLDPVRGYV